MVDILLKLGVKMNFIPQEIYNTIITNVPIACVDIAIIANGSILLVKRKDAPAMGQWWVPGGRVLKGEMMVDTAKRKAREEVGIDCYVGPIIHTAETIFEDGPNGIPIHSINSCFLLCPSDLEECELDSHHFDYKWVKSITPDLHSYVKCCLKNAGLK